MPDITIRANQLEQSANNTEGVPGEVDVKVLDREHPEHTNKRKLWDKISLLYAGGESLSERSEEFLQKRPKENADVFAARRSMFVYTNHIGTAVDWYTGELFEKSPDIEAYSPVGDDRPKPEQSVMDFYNKFQENCDRAGTSFLETVRKCFKDVLLFQKAYVLYDIPSQDPSKYLTLADQIQDGLRDPYICSFTPKEAINWQCDKDGNLDWIVFKVTTQQSTGPFDEPALCDRWYIYDRKNFQIYERVRAKDDKEKSSSTKFAQLVAGPRPHLLSSSNQVPVKVVTVPDGLWLANRAYLAAIAHLNMDNSLQWALFMAALAMPVIFTDDTIDLTLSEVAHIKLSPTDRYEWSEPEGKSWEHIAKRISDLTENIYRSFYLIHQGRSGRATPTAQSGISKQIDMMPSKDILRMFGDLVKNFMRGILNDIVTVRGEQKKVRWDVRGFHFQDEVPLESMQSIQTALGMKVPSKVFQDATFAKIVRMLLPDIDNDTMRQILDQIAEAASAEDRELEGLKKRAKVIADAAPKPAAKPPVGQPAPGISKPKAA